MATVCWASTVGWRHVSISNVTIARDQSKSLPRYQRKGLDFLYVIRGEAVHQCRADDFVLGVSDTLSFDAMLAHDFTEILSEEVEVITVR